MAWSIALRARPTAAEATIGRVWSKAPMAILNPCPSEPSTFALGTLTSSKVMPRVSLARWPMFCSFLPTVMPGLSRGTMKPVSPRVPLSGSVEARRKYQSATPEFVIHILLPLMT
jgi:hypothetical protein